jgi:hypothetical protein
VHLFYKYIKPKAQRLVNYALKMQRLTSQRGEYIFIASSPKSGSTFMAKAMSHLTGYRYYDLADAYERNDQNLYLPKLIDVYSQGSVTHQHLRATGPNLELLNMFSIRPVIMTRNIFDTVVSIRDHMFKEGYAFPTFYCNERFAELDEHSQFDQIIELGIPWYFNFYVSWFEATRNHQIDALWINYEDVVQDWDKALVKLADFYGIEKTPEEIATALQQTREMKRTKTRLNKGVVGRGESALTTAQKDRIRSMARFYSWVDFSAIGIT